MHFVAVTGSPGKIQCLGFEIFFPFQEKPSDSLQPPLWKRSDNCFFPAAKCQMFLFASPSTPYILQAEEENWIFFLTEYGRHIHTLIQILQRRDEPYIVQIKSVWGIAAFVCVWICITVPASGRASKRRTLISQHYVLTHSVFPCRTEKGGDEVTSEQTASAPLLHPAQPEWYCKQCVSLCRTADFITGNELNDDNAITCPDLELW